MSPLIGRIRSSGLAAHRRAMMRNFLKDPQRKNFAQMVYELSRVAARTRGLPVAYFTRFLYRRGATNYLDYLGNHEIVRIRSRIYHREAKRILSDKLRFYRHFEAAGLRVPMVYGHTDRNRLLLHSGETVDLTGGDAVAAALAPVLADAPGRELFVKPVTGLGGEGCFTVSEEDLTQAERRVSLHEILVSKPHLIQERLRQHPLLDEIYAGSINTVRLDTFVEEDGTVHLISALIRFGAAGSVVDNGSSGGFFVPVDLEKGTLGRYGRSYLEHGGAIFTRHPDSNKRFEGFVLPYFDSAKEIVRVAARVTENRLVGWDVAITPDGVVLVEGNHDYHIPMAEIAYGGYRSHPVFKKILQKYGR